MHELAFYKDNFNFSKSLKKDKGKIIIDLDCFNLIFLYKFFRIFNIIAVEILILIILFIVLYFFYFIVILLQNSGVWDENIFFFDINIYGSSNEIFLECYKLVSNFFSKSENDPLLLDNIKKLKNQLNTIRGYSSYILTDNNINNNNMVYLNKSIESYPQKLNVFKYNERGIYKVNTYCNVKYNKRHPFSFFNTGINEFTYIALDNCDLFHFRIRGTGSTFYNRSNN